MQTVKYYRPLCHKVETATIFATGDAHNKSIRDRIMLGKDFSARTLMLKVPGLNMQKAIEM